jgi:hypothetical protein
MAGLTDIASVLAPVPYQQSLELQQRSHVLVLMLPSGSAWDGVYSGKFFEYCGARRPILAITGGANVAGQIVRQSNLGLATNDAGEIARWRDRQIEAKRTGRIPTLSPVQVEEFSRNGQTKRLEQFLFDVLNQQRQRSQLAGASQHELRRRSPAETAQQ